MNLDLSCSQVWHAFGMTFCGETLIDTWIISLIVLIWATIATWRPGITKFGVLQNSWEMMWEFVGNYIGTAPTPGQRYFLNRFLMTLFLFLLGSNLLGLIPGLHSPTNTLNTDLGLAVIVFFIVQGWALVAKGGAGLKRLIHGGAMGWAMLPITILEEFAKPVTLSMRLYGNIFAGELIILVIVGLLHYVGAIISPFWYAFSIFVGAVQAFLFMVLTLAYVGQSTSEEGDHH